MPQSYIKLTLRSGSVAEHYNVNCMPWAMLVVSPVIRESCFIHEDDHTFIVERIPQPLFTIFLANAKAE